MRRCTLSLSPERQKATLVELARRVLLAGSRVAVLWMGDHRHDPEFAKLPVGRFSLYKSIPKSGVRAGTGVVFRTRLMKGHYTDTKGSKAIFYGRRVGFEVIKEVILESCKGLPNPPRKAAPDREVLQFKAISHKKNGANSMEVYAGAERRIAQKRGLLVEKAKLVKELEAINGKLAEIAILENARAVLVAATPKT